MSSEAQDSTSISLYVIESCRLVCSQIGSPIAQHYASLTAKYCSSVASGVIVIKIGNPSDEGGAIADAETGASHCSSG